MTILLMTGTIRPAAGARNLARTDVKSRIDDYRRALQFNIGLLRRGVLGGIVFVENSGHGTECLADIVAKSGFAHRIETISYDARQAAGEPRFLGECRLLAQAFARSRLIAEATDSHVWKVTGRYIVRNMARILRGSENRHDLILHCRNYPMRYVDFGFAGFARQKGGEIVARILASGPLESTDERVLRRLLDEGVFDDLDVRCRFSHIPDFAGVRGSDNASYSGLRYRLRYLLRALCNRFAPRVWL